MYKYGLATKTSIKSVTVYEGERIEQKIERIVSNNEPIKDGSPEIFTERKDGVIAAYNIRTDRWEIAAEAMDAIARNTQAKRDGLPKIGSEEGIAKEAAGEKKETNGKKAPSVEGKKVGEAKSIQGGDSPK